MPRGRALVVEDNAAVQQGVRKMLMALAFEKVDVCFTATDAMPVLQERTAELVVCDLELPSMTGLDLRRLMLGRPALASAPFLLLTTPAQKAELWPTYHEMVPVMLAKPFSQAQLSVR